jgi:hypothetical protein
MSQTYTLEFHNVTVDVFLRLKTELAKSAKITTDPNGDLNISGDGIVAEAHYDPSSQTLTVDIMDRPWYVTVDNIRQHIMSALQAAQSGKA